MTTPLKALNQFWTNLAATTKEKETLLVTLRLGLYLFLLILLVLGMWMIAKRYQQETFLEYGPIENMQITILIITTCLFIGQAFYYRPFRPILLFLAGLTGFCCIRELDSFFEQLIPVIKWKFAFFLPLIRAGYMFTQRHTLRKPFFDFLNSSAFHLMVTAIIVFIPVAQCIGHRPLITDAIGSSDNLSYIRRMVEESAELMAYVLIFLSGIEMFFGVLKKKN